ncbi:two-component regulator propeller domain-containing protein, partial [Bacteroidota bacterium]
MDYRAVKINLLSLTISIVFLSNIFTQNNQYLFNQINEENGLSNNSITCIYKDSRGFIWIGTTDGLNRYDGYDFLIFKHDPSDSSSISDNFISAIVEDFVGNLWIGTQGGGLSVYNPYSESFKTHYHDPDNINTISSNFIFHHNSLHIDKNNILWIGTDNGLCSYNLNEDVFIRHELLLENEDKNKFKDVRIIFEDRNEMLWIGTNSGLIKYSKENGILRTFINNKNDPTSISNNIIIAIEDDYTREKLWIGTEDGLNCFNLKNETFIKYFERSENNNSISDNSITSIVKDNTDNLWIGTKSGGLNKYDPVSNKFASLKYDPANNSGLSDNYIDYLYYDNEGLLWVGTVNTGINLLDLKKKKFSLIKNDPTNPNSLSYNTIRSIFEDKEGIIWIGTYGGGLNKHYNNKFSHFYHQPGNIHSLSHNIVSTINEDNSGNLWIGTWGGGLNIMDKQTSRIYRKYVDIPEFINDIYIDKNEKIWIGCNGGLYVYDQSDKSIQRFDSESDDKRKLTAVSINKVIDDRFGNLWIGTWDGLNKIMFKENSYEIDTIIHFRMNPSNSYSLSDNRIITLHEDRSGSIWVSTYAGGLNKIVNNNNDLEDINSYKFIYYTDKDGLAGNTIYGILEDDHRCLWLSTNNGLTKFDTKKNTFNNFDIDDGLQGSQFYWRAYMKNNSGIMYFGGTNGLNYFHPDSIEYNKEFPEVFITDLLLFNKPIKVGKRENERQILEKSIIYTDHITLTRKDYAFTFEFAALNFRSQNNIKYAYQLESFDDNFIYTDAKKRYATYSHLRPGDYTFKVKSTNDDGLWNDKFTSIRITVLPAYYETVWAFIIYGIILVLLLYVFRIQIIAKAKYKHDIQLERIERENIEKYNDMKLKFFTNISHEFKTPLTLILGPLSNLLSLSKLDKKVADQLSLMNIGSKRLLRLVNQLMEFRKVETGNQKLNIAKSDIIPLLKEIAFTFESKSVQSKINYSLSLPANSALIWFDSNIVETIVYNLLSNAFKYTPENGSIKLNVSFINEKSEIVIPNQAEEEFIQIEVSDTGKGIPKNRIENIFKRFYQIDAFQKQKRGTGLGLALCKDLVELHHGEISVESEEHKGTIFSIKIPVKESFYTKDEFIGDEEDDSPEIKDTDSLTEEIIDEIKINQDIATISFNLPEDKNARSIL